MARLCFLSGSVDVLTFFTVLQLSQAGDLIIEVYLEKKIPDCCITLKVSRIQSVIIIPVVLIVLII